MGFEVAAVAAVVATEKVEGAEDAEFEGETPVGPISSPKSNVLGNAGGNSPR